MAAQVSLQDGRRIRLPLVVEAARPVVTVIGKADIMPPQDATAPKNQLHIRLPDEQDLPVGDVLTFSLKSTRPFPRNGMIEIASQDGALHTTLSLADSNPSLIMESPDTLLATLQPIKVFGPSAFGPIRVRAVGPDGAAGDWLPLVTLVRLPTISSLNCTVAEPAAAARPVKRTPARKTDAPPAAGVDAAGNASAASPVPAATAGADPVPETSASTEPSSPDKPAAGSPTAASSTASCTLSGAGLYFIDSVATDDSFTNPTRVPEGFVGTSISVPPPNGAVYYLRLRDDPATVDTVTLPAGPL
jgi:hypothetical protein